MSEISFCCALENTKYSVSVDADSVKKFLRVSKTFYATLQRVQNWSLVVAPFRGQAGNALLEVCECVKANERGRERKFCMTRTARKISG